eukprot:2855253-Pyramimonas_sp.AAC.1
MSKRHRRAARRRSSLATRGASKILERAGFSRSTWMSLLRQSCSTRTVKSTQRHELGAVVPVDLAGAQAVH